GPRALWHLRGTRGERWSAPHDASSDERGEPAAPFRVAGSAGSRAAGRYGASPPPARNAALRRPRGSSGGGGAPCADSYHQRLNTAGKMYWTPGRPGRIVGVTPQRWSSRLARGRSTHRQFAVTKEGSMRIAFGLTTTVTVLIVSTLRSWAQGRDATGRPVPHPGQAVRSARSSRWASSPRS